MNVTELIRAEKLYRYYGKHCAVEELDLLLNKGEVLGLLGRNGAGKTTTLQMLCGNLAPSSGQISINHIDLLDRPQTAKKFLGYLPDTPPLYRELTVEEFLTFCASLHRIPRPEQKTAIARAVERCSLGQAYKRVIGNLSKGFQQRIGIAQAILHNPEIVILDEPTTGLDPLQIREIRTLIRELGKDHGIILSTHALSEVQESCTHVLIIDQGKSIFRETVEGLKKHMNTTTLCMATRNQADTEQIRGIAGVFDVDQLAGNRYTIHHHLQADPAERLAEIAVTAGWGLLELTPKQKTIEEIFVDITTHTGEPC